MSTPGPSRRGVPDPQESIASRGHQDAIGPLHGDLRITDAARGVRALPRLGEPAPDEVCPDSQARKPARFSAALHACAQQRATGLEPATISLEG